MSMTSHNGLASSFDIVQTVYCSHATNSESKSEFERDLRDILDYSAIYNSLHEISSALVTDGNMFAHVLEGPSAAVKNLYFKIMHDKRHSRILMLQHTVVHVRLFDFWPVAFLRVGTMPHATALNAQSAPVELRKASISILKAFRPILLK